MSTSIYRCMIVDDEPQAHEVLKSHITLVPSLRWVASCYNGVEAMATLREQTVDLLFLDIQMPQLLGTSLIKTLSSAPKVVFVTAHREFAMEGFDLGVVDYLLKPVSFERFLKAINKAIPNGGSDQANSPSSSGRYLYFRVNRKMVKVYLDEILYVESLKDYVKIATRQGVLITKVSLSGIADMLPDSSFIQVHRSFIVAVAHIDAYDAENLRMGKSEIPVGPLYKNAVRSRMQDLKWP